MFKTINFLSLGTGGMICFSIVLGDLFLNKRFHFKLRVLCQRVEVLPNGDSSHL